MGAIFGSGSSVVSVGDNSRVPLILIEGSGSGDMFTSCMEGVYIMNFDSSDRCDIQILKRIDTKFLFNTFGHSLTQINVAGFQATGIDTSSNGMQTIQSSSKKVQDIEQYYRSHCISGAHPEVFKITTGTGEIFSRPSVFRGYMVAFSRKPMGEEKIQGYGFNISFICEKDTDYEGSI